MSIFGVAASADTLTRNSLFRLLVEQNAHDPQPVPAQGTISQINSVGVFNGNAAGMIATGSTLHGRYLLALGPRILCYFTADETFEEEYSAEFILGVKSSIETVLNEANRDAGSCHGTFFIDNIGRTHIFLQTVVVTEGYAGIWISDAGSVPIRHFAAGFSNNGVFEALAELEMQPDAIVALGTRRFAYRLGSDVIVALLVESGDPISVVVCPAPTDHPLFSSTSFSRYGEREDVARQAVLRPSPYDPLAYFACP